MNFKLSGNYAMVRDHFIKRVKRRFAIYCLMVYWGGFWSQYIVMTVLSDAVNDKGLTLGLYDVGFTT